MCAIAPYWTVSEVIDWFEIGLPSISERTYVPSPMNEDRDTRDQDPGPGAMEQETPAGSGVAGDVWARAAEQALRDVARAQRRTAATEKGTA